MDCPNSSREPQPTRSPSPAGVTVFNDGQDGQFVTVVRERGTETFHDELHLRPGAGRTLEAPPGPGRVTVCVYGPQTVATAGYRPPERPPAFSLRQDVVLVFDE